MEVEEKTSHYVQLDDGTYAEMVEGHELVGPGHQMLVEVRILTSDWSKFLKLYSHWSGSRWSEAGGCQPGSW